MAVEMTSHSSQSHCLRTMEVNRDLDIALGQLAVVSATRLVLSMDETHDMSLLVAHPDLTKRLIGRRVAKSRVETSTLVPGCPVINSMLRNLRHVMVLSGVASGAPNQRTLQHQRQNMADPHGIRLMKGPSQRV